MVGLQQHHLPLIHATKVNCLGCCCGIGYKRTLNGRLSVEDLVFFPFGLGSCLDAQKQVSARKAPFFGL